MNERYTTEEAAIELGVPATVIAQWKHRGRIVPVANARGRRGKAAPLYDLDELRPHAEAYHRRAEKRATRRNRMRRLASGDA